VEGFVKRCVLRWLLLFLVAGPLQAEQTPSSPASDAIFLWLAGGISNARIQRLAQTWGEAETLSCPATSQCNRQCTRALQKAGADAGLIKSLLGHGAEPKAESDSPSKISRQQASSSCTCAGPAAQVAALVHDKDFDAAENKIRALIHDDAGNRQNQALQNQALQHFVLGNILRREDRFDEALDEFM